MFRNFTSSRSSKAPPPTTHSHASPTAASLQTQQQITLDTSRGGVYGGPLEYEQLHGQLRNGKSLAERRSAADTLRLALADYSLDGVCTI